MTVQRPRVAYAVPIFGYPPRGGPRLRTYNTLRAISRCADLSLFVWQQPDVEDAEEALAHLRTFCQDVRWVDPPPKPRGLGALARKLLPASAIPAARTLYRRVRPVPPAPPEPPRDEAAEWAERLDVLEQWVVERQADVVWLGFGGISYPLLNLKERTGRPVVLETESIWSRFVLRELPFENDPVRKAEIEREGRAKEEEERWGAQVADCTTAVSDVEAQYFKDLAPERADRVMVIANVIDVDSYEHDASTGPRLEPKSLVFSGTMARGTANVDAAVWLVDEVMPSVWSRVPDLHLYLVGRHPAPEVVALAKRDRRIHVTGEVASIAPYMKQSIGSVVPLRWESGTRFKILEAFACKTPVVSTTLGAEGLEVTHDRDVLLADTPAEMADAVVALAQDHSLRARLSQAGYELVRRDYDVSSAARQVADVLRRLGFDGVTANT